MDKSETPVISNQKPVQSTPWMLRFYGSGSMLLGLTAEGFARLNANVPHDAMATEACTTVTNCQGVQWYSPFLLP